MGVETPKRKKRRSSKILSVIAIVLVLLLLGAGGYAYYLYANVKETANKITDKKQWNGSDKRYL